ncbi:unnamed protein product [marine sediment metagenome]|uniref:Uncharacterized protein n=1 Tax=marine sediment metagenome TaxID=412755 RepID=X1NZE7_9ZZZZ
MADLGPGQKPIVMPHYPHMMSEDIDVWSAYLTGPVVPVKRVWYDVHVGKAVEVAGGAKELLPRIAAGVTRKRIDVVAAVGGGYWVVEVKPYGSFLALGQVLTYTRLFVAEYRPDGEVWPVVVCREFDRDLMPDFERQGVGMIQI